MFENASNPEFRMRRREVAEVAIAELEKGFENERQLSAAVRGSIAEIQAQVDRARETFDSSSDAAEKEGWNRILAERLTALREMKRVLQKSDEGFEKMTSEYARLQDLVEESSGDAIKNKLN